MGNTNGLTETIERPSRDTYHNIIRGRLRIDQNCPKLLVKSIHNDDNKIIITNMIIIIIII